MTDKVVGPFSWIRALREGTLTQTQLESLQALVDNDEAESLEDAARSASGPQAWSGSFRKHGVRVDGESADLTARANLEALSDWLREGVAAAISTTDRPVSPPSCRQQL